MPLIATAKAVHRMTTIDIGPLQDGPHAPLIAAMARRCFADPRIQAVWVGGSLAAGRGDAYSDVDFRVAVAPGQVEEWAAPDWQRYLPLPAPGSLLLRFGEQALLHHMVLADGTIVDFYVQDTTAVHVEPQVVLLACRDAGFGERLAAAVRPPAPLVRPIEPAAARQLLVDYWITTHKQIKALARRYDEFAFGGLFHERLALLRAWYMQAAGQDIDARPTLHVVAALHAGLEGHLAPQQQALLGLPSRTPAETAAAIDAVRGEMAAVGRELAARHGFAYPDELEAVVQQCWHDYKASAGL